MKFCIIFKKISLANTQGTVKIRLDGSKLCYYWLLWSYRLWNNFKNTLWWLYKTREIFLFYIKDNKYLFFIKIGEAKTLQKERSYLSHQAISNILEGSAARRIQNGYYHLDGCCSSFSWSGNSKIFYGTQISTYKNRSKVHTRLFYLDL